MRLRAAVVLLAVAAAPQIRYFRHERPVLVAADHAGQTCVALDAATFAHAAAGLADLRLYRAENGNETETPYTIYEPAPVTAQPKEIAPLNLGKHGGTTTFEAEMPAGRYSDVDLDVTAKNFIATVAVTGSRTETGSEGTELGIFTIFDLTGQKLGRSMVLHLPESDFRYLYFGITGPVKPGDVQGLSVERVSTQQRFVAVTAPNPTATAPNGIVQKGRETQATFTVPAHVPVDRVEIVPGAQPVNFSRDVKVTATGRVTQGAGEAALPVRISSAGTLLRVHGVHDGRRIDEEDLAVETTNADFAAPDSVWTVTIENGDDAPLDLKSLRLEMAVRKLCFDAAVGAAYTLYYGDAALATPQYDYATLFTPDKNAAEATLAPEKANPLYVARPDTRPFTDRYPWLLWVALVLVVALLGAVALRTAKETAPPR